MGVTEPIWSNWRPTLSNLSSGWGKKEIYAPLLEWCTHVSSELTTDTRMNIVPHVAWHETLPQNCPKLKPKNTRFAWAGGTCPRFAWARKLIQKYLFLSDYHSFTLSLLLALTVWRTDWLTEKRQHSLRVGWRNLPTLRVGWRNFFSSCAVVLDFGSGGK